MNFKILSTNLEYARGLDGSIKDWILKGYRAIFISPKTENKNLNKFKKIIQRENPDLICITEIKKNQISTLINKEYQYYKINVKYTPGSKFEKSFLHKNNCNTIISKHNLNIQKINLKNGFKTLLYEIDLPNNIKLIHFHFSQNKKIRHKQFQEIAKMYQNQKLKIICGDFNIVYGLKELNKFIQQSNLKILNQKPTFPSIKPIKFYDLSLYSPELHPNLKILPDIFSDHLATILTIKL